MRRTILLVVLLLSSRGAHALGQSTPARLLTGSVTTQDGTVRLPGAAVTVIDIHDHVVATAVTDESGRFALALPPGRYTAAAALDGFTTIRQSVEVGTRSAVDIAIDLPIAAIAQRVDVVADNPVSTSDGTIAPTESIGGRELDQFAPTGGLQSSLRLLASVLEMPGGMSIKGGRPDQAGVQLGPSSLVDPSTGLTQFALPDDAIDSVAVLPNPYAVEYGRFSSGLVVIQSRRAGDEWRVRLNNLDPTFRSTRTSPFDLIGVGWWGPRLEVGGPLVKGRLFLEQAAQFRYRASDVPSRPIDELRTSRSFSSFTRLDGVLSPRQSFVATGAFVPGVADQATLGTFTPPQATVNLHATANQGGFTDRVVWSSGLLGETTVQAHDYQTDTMPQGTALMELRPETTLGNFYNQQDRDTATFQAVSSLSGTHTALGGSHLYKVGVDVMHSVFDALSLSRDVAIETSDGTIVRRLDYPSIPSAEHVSSTDVALFAQDRFQPTQRWYTEFGVRIDRDGISQRFNTTPRAGAAWVLDASGTAVIRGGFGLFYERTPSTAGGFDQLGSYVDTRLATGSAPPMLPQTVVYRTAPDLQTPRSRTWDLSYEQRLSPHWSFRVSGIDREGTHELIVNPIQQGPTLEALSLSSDGRSAYRGVEFGVHGAYGQRGDLNLSYARASARADLNALSTYFDAVPTPVIGVNQYAPASSDVPDRLFARGRLMPTDRWLLLGIFDWRSGLPYSIVNANLDFVGARNSFRFPTYDRLEVGIERRFRILKFQPWIGVRIWNALNSFLPTDVQGNTSSLAYGSLYNSEYRQFRIQVRFER